MIDDASAEADEIIYLAISRRSATAIGAGGAMQVISQNDYAVTNLGDFNPDLDPNGGEGLAAPGCHNAKQD